MSIKKHMPNLLTMLSMLLAPLAMWLSMNNGNTEYIIGGMMFLVCCITDFLDGYLSSKWKVTSSFGKTFDPMADKVLIIGCLMGFLMNGHVLGWMALALMMSDVTMDVISLCLYSKNSIFPAMFMAKAKTMLQMFGSLMMFFLWHKGTNGWLYSNVAMDWVVQMPLMVAVVLSWVSFVYYISAITHK